MAWEILGLRSIARVCSGLWGYLTVRVEARTAVELERERNRGTVQAIRALPPGAQLYESEPDGRTREIRMPHTATTTTPTVVDAAILPPAPDRELPQ